MISSVMFAGAGLLGAPLSTQSILAFSPMFAWIALGVMSVYWVQDRSCHWFWPSFGSLCGIISAISFVDLFYFYISSIPLAFYLAFWHMNRRLGSGSLHRYDQSET